MSLISRLWQYQRERFPLVMHIPLITAFSFSAIAFSRICRGEHTFIPLTQFIAGVFMSLTLFLLLRIFDEFKDREEDAIHRAYLPVPRGLVKLTELRNLGWIVVALQLIVQVLVFPKMLILYAFVMAYLLLMAKEFLISEWLKEHMLWYVISHMFIIPFVDIYESGIDWFLHGAQPPVGLIFFFIVSFFNGLVLEVGRKIRTPADEEFNTYSRRIGAVSSTRLWIALLTATLIAACLAARYAGYGLVAYLVLGGLFLVCLAPAVYFLLKPGRKGYKMIELASGIWTFGMYLSLGAIPFILS